jgi:leucine dehydrogenase
MELLYQETEHVITLPEYCGGAGNIGPATAFGVQQAMKACAHEVWGSESLQGRTIALQGLGAVGWPALEGLVKEGASVVVADIDAAKVERARKEFGVSAVDHDKGILYAPDYIANAGGTIFDTDRIAQKGGFNRERAWNNVARIRERMTELIEISTRERIPTSLAADRLAERRLAMARQLRMI